MSHKLRIKEGACIICDAHYSPQRPELLGLIKAIHSKQIPCPQLILMGDIFDALFGFIRYTYVPNEEMITLLREIADEIEVVYFEGNHDFNLKALFSNIKIYPLRKQPVMAEYQGKIVALAHGDFDGKLGYKIYTALIRNPAVLFVLEYIDIALGHKIMKSIERYLSKKDDCVKLSWFEDFIRSRFKNRFVCDYFIEGHFHQNKTLQLADFTYINLAAFACNQRYFIVKSLQDKEILEEKRWMITP